MNGDASDKRRPAGPANLGPAAPLPAVVYERELGVATAPLPPSVTGTYKRRQSELTALHAKKGWWVLASIRAARQSQTFEIRLKISVFRCP